MGRAKTWVYTDIVDGVSEVKISKWRYFVDYISKELLNYRTYVFRGHRRDDWILESTLDRLMQKNEKGINKIEHLNKFKYAVRGRRGANPSRIENENDWWALGQHHGLATPLLDWTGSPFVAAYFAYIEEDDANQTEHRVVYALAKMSIERKAKEKRMQENKALSEVVFHRPLSDENQRLVNQDGLFTHVSGGGSIENWVKKNYKGEKNNYILIKIFLPNKDREHALKMLNRMNINHCTMFPDLYGASVFCNIHSQIDRY